MTSLLLCLLAIPGIIVASLAPIAIAFQDGVKKENRRIRKFAASNPSEFDAWILEVRLEASQARIEELQKSLPEETSTSVSHSTFINPSPARG